MPSGPRSRFRKRIAEVWQPTANFRFRRLSITVLFFFYQPPLGEPQHRHVGGEDANGGDTGQPRPRGAPVALINSRGCRWSQPLNLPDFSASSPILRAGSEIKPFQGPCALHFRGATMPGPPRQAPTRTSTSSGRHRRAFVQGSAHSRRPAAATGQIDESRIRHSAIPRSTCGCVSRGDVGAR